MADKDHLILTAVGPDKVGLVQKLTELIARRGCNIEDSKMAVFCGEFAVIVLISGPSDSLAAIARDRQIIETTTGLAISIKTPAIRQAVESLLPFRLTASCLDHPGIVYRLSGLLSGLGINIESMETKTYAAPVSGTPIFRLEARISVPAKTSIATLRSMLAEIQNEENIDIELVAVAV